MVFRRGSDERINQLIATTGGGDSGERKLSDESHTLDSKEIYNGS
jgi:hypothetical protein